MDRRTFLTWVGVGGIASSLPVAIAACSNKTTTTSNETASNPAVNSGAVARADGFQPVGTVATLDQKGQLGDQKFVSGPLLVVRNPDSPDTLAAVNASCTHKACLVDWQAEQKVFVCLCHDSKFGTDGKVLQGPATEPLKTYETKLEGDTVLVKV
ncbi:ubiquinol-cytochrome c reductase iron-sulfur subunit [Trichocoleus sp. FACHB-262]|uniref:QcrA and Rieske domain-containing protein n=1 Tax=Trichocoleus sp. FACHB-262 TaxID=2692869 RepID=UPI0016821060|nr:ubiquinol-cytochrome c reductase iron-sulfur subunit [Trichocoleus sp. FACHB-262]MBD2122554.1 ubiquinol-cytochrome c reductase iron-sulfur subunit [Trichocoleus sp. FACHB-262]